jgi:hypothetical protein
MGIRNRDSCREHFRKFKILPLQSKYILSLSLFVFHTKNYSKLNSEMCSINTTTKSYLHQLLYHLKPIKKEIFWN